jgi:hypothetical protein
MHARKGAMDNCQLANLAAKRPGGRTAGRLGGRATISGVRISMCARKRATLHGFVRAHARRSCDAGPHACARLRMPAHVRARLLSDAHVLACVRTCAVRVHAHARPRARAA